MFEKKLKFHSSYWKFNECKNFTVRRGIDERFNEGDHIKLVCYLDQLDAKITGVQLMRFSDIKDFEHWHCKEFTTEWKNWHEVHSVGKEKIDCSPIDTMRKIYGHGFDKNEIVTVIWFRLI